MNSRLPGREVDITSGIELYDLVVPTGFCKKGPYTAKETQLEARF